MGSPTNRQFQDTFPLFLCLVFKCVQSVSLCHYQIGHTYFTEEMKVFLLLVTSAFWWSVSHQDDLKDIARGERLSPLCMHSSSSCDHMLVWMFVPKCAFVRKWICVSACMYLSDSVCTDIWPKKHANTPKTSEKGSMSRVKVSNTAYWATSLSSCCSSDVQKSTFLYPELLNTNTAGSSLCQAETNCIIKDFSQSLHKRKKLIDSLWCRKVRTQ